MPCHASPASRPPGTPFTRGHGRCFWIDAGQKASLGHGSEHTPQERVTRRDGHILRASQPTMDGMLPLVTYHWRPHHGQTNLHRVRRGGEGADPTSAAGLFRCSMLEDGRDMPSSKEATIIAFVTFGPISPSHSFSAFHCAFIVKPASIVSFASSLQKASPHHYRFRCNIPCKQPYELK